MLRGRLRVRVRRRVDIHRCSWWMDRVRKICGVRVLHTRQSRPNGEWSDVAASDKLGLDVDCVVGRTGRTVTGHWTIRASRWLRHGCMWLPYRRRCTALRQRDELLPLLPQLVALFDLEAEHLHLRCFEHEHPKAGQEARKERHRRRVGSEVADGRCCVQKQKPFYRAPIRLGAVSYTHLTLPTIYSV